MSIVARATWGMPGPLGPAMALPAQVLYLHHSVTTAANGYTAVRQVAQIGVNRFGRASYSYACTPDGGMYEMQGTHIGAHTAGQNSTSLAVVLVGNYETTQISNAQVNAVAWLHRHLTSTRRLRAEAPLRGHRDAPGASTACPGRTAYAALPTIRARITGSQPPPSPEEDEMTPEQREWLDGELATIRGKVEQTFNQVNRKTGAVYNAVIASRISPEELAAKIVAELPEGGVDQATVEAGVEAVFGKLADEA